MNTCPKCGKFVWTRKVIRSEYSGFVRVYSTHWAGLDYDVDKICTNSGNLVEDKKNELSSKEI